MSASMDDLNKDNLSIFGQSIGAPQPPIPKK